MISVKKCKTSLVILLLCSTLVPYSSNGASHQRNNADWQALHRDCNYGRLEVARGVPDNNDQTPLHQACRYNSVTTVQLLIQQGADVNTQDENGMTPLHYACTNFNNAGLKIAQLLIESGARVNILDKYGKTPLRHAYLLGLLEIAQLLVRHGAIVNKPTTNVNRPTTKHQLKTIAYLSTICDTEEHFNPHTTPATLELLQRFIACTTNAEYVLTAFKTQTQALQKELMKHALLHNTNLLMKFYSCPHCDNLLTLRDMLTENNYLQTQYKQLSLKKLTNWHITTASNFANTLVITFDQYKFNNLVKNILKTAQNVITYHNNWSQI